MKMRLNLKVLQVKELILKNLIYKYNNKKKYKVTHN